MSVNEMIFEFVFIEAMGDATSQKALAGSKRMFSDISNFPRSKESIREFVENVLNKSFLDQASYDAKYLELAKTVCHEIADITDDNEFTFGNAQKLINMTLKYFFISTYGQSDAERGKFRFCHCPMDRTMIDSVWEHRDELGNLMKGVKSDYFHKGWGKLDFEDGDYPERYKVFQRAVRHLSNQEGLFPIEYDFWKWNESKSE